MLSSTGSRSPPNATRSRGSWTPFQAWSPCLTPAGEVDVVNHELVEYCGQGLEAMKQWGTNGTVHSRRSASSRAKSLHRRSRQATPYDFEARVRRFDGVYRWFQIRGLPHRDEPARITRWYVLLTDIDDRKRAEAGLRQVYRSSRRSPATEQDGQLHHGLAGRPPRLVRRGLPHLRVRSHDQALRCRRFGAWSTPRTSPSTTPRTGAPSTGSVSI